MKRRMLILLVILSLLPFGPAMASMVTEYASNGSLPSRYDMREDGIVTPVKLQYPWGTCWSFGTIAAAETSIFSSMDKTWEEYPLDLSELHAAWFAKRPIQAVDDPGQAGEGIQSDEFEDPQVGEQQRLNSGLQYMVAALFSSGGGPVAESSYPGSSGKRTWMYAALGYFGEMARVIVHPGESFVKESGNWQDWTEAVKSIDSDGNLFDNFAIKAFYRE